MSEDSLEHIWGDPRRERGRQDQAAIDRILSRPGVREALTKFSESFQQQPGEPYIFGMRPDGLVVAVREGRIEDTYSNDYFRAWALDATLPPEEIVEKGISTSFSYRDVDRMRDGGTTSFPEHGGTIDKKAKLSDEEAAKIEDPGLRSRVLFCKRTGGFDVPSLIQTGPGTAGNTLPSTGKGAGKQYIYPLEL